MLPLITAVGLKEAGRGKAVGKNRATCFVCTTAIEKNAIFLTYRLKQGKGFDGVRRCRYTCCAGIPAATRIDGLNVLRHLRALSIDEEIKVCLAAAEVLLEP